MGFNGSATYGFDDDDGGTFPTEPRHEPPSVGRIESIACPAPCDVSDRSTLAELDGFAYDLHAYFGRQEAA